jgi:DNA-binding transcriptional regulator YiaG
MDSKYVSEFLGSLHETAVGLHKIGVISDDEMREYDRDCLKNEGEVAPKAATKQTQPIPTAFAGPKK